MKMNRTTMHLIPLCDRIVQHHALGTIVINVQVMMNFFKAGPETSILQQFAIMVALYQNLATVESMHVFGGFWGRQKCHVTQDVNQVLGFN
jgi:hypothetical protein